MTAKAAIKRHVTKHIFSLKRRDAKRRKAERKRRALGAPHRIEYFHEAGDPYSHLMVQMLPGFCDRYDIELKTHIVPPPEDWAAPERSKLESYGRRDATLLADRIGLNFTDLGRAPTADEVSLANEALGQAISTNSFLEKAYEIGHQTWSTQADRTAPPIDAITDTQLRKGAQRRDELGHYLGGTLYYAGEWYWGPDRLHYLESRLSELGANIGDAPLHALYSPPAVPRASAPPENDARPILHWYLSFRSPYTGIVGSRVKALADAYGAELRLRFVLPMVMRGLPVPRKKGFYIMSDAAREADRHGVDFGDSVDPVGKPVERGYAILSRAIELGQGFEFAQSFLQGVWSDGIDAGSDRGLKKIAERAGLNWAEMQPLLGGHQWRAEAEANRAEMMDLGIWGVPSFRVDDTAIWGQDRLWVIEDALRHH